MRTREIVALGIGQCVNWGVLYYAFAVVLVPVEADLDVARWVVTGAFSLALLMSAVLAPTIGRWSDRGHGPLVMQAGGFTAAGLLWLWASVPSVTTLYIAWAGLGLCMAAVLYEPAFAIVGRAHDHPAARLRALATVTVFGGLASTVFLPVTAFLVRGLGWRAAVGVLGVVLAASTCLTRVVAFRRAPSATAAAPERRLSTSERLSLRVPGFGFVLVAFSLASFASAAFTANLVPALGEQKISPTTAAVFGGLLGIMQLPGRVLLMHGTLATSPARLVVISLLLQGVGLAAVALAPSVFMVAGGIAVFAIGAGVGTLVRPHLVQTVYGTDAAGSLNGRVALAQQLSRASGPILAALSATALGYATVFGFLAVVLAIAALASQRALVPWKRGALHKSRSAAPAGKARRASLLGISER
jgi:MFS family permease